MRIDSTGACARSVVVLLAVLASGVASARSQLPIATAERVGMSTERLALLTPGMQGVVDQSKLSGVVTLVARHGKVVHFDAVGKQDIEANQPMARDTIFRIYSMTKPIAGVALMILFEQGKWQLDDPVAKFIPEFKDLKVHAGTGSDGKPILAPQTHPMTMRELMSHTAGFTYGLFGDTPVDTLQRQANVLDNDSTLQTMVQRVAQLPLYAQPGAQWHYSIAVDIQGYLVEKLSGMPFDQFLDQYLLQPLGMVDTAFYVPIEKRSRLAQLYATDEHGKLRVDAGTSPRDWHQRPVRLSGGGGMVSTAADYFRFCQMLLNGGTLDGVRILSPLTVKLIRTNAIGDTKVDLGPPGTQFGLGFAIFTDPVAAGGYYGEGTYWWSGAAGTWFTIDPIRDLIVIGMTQQRKAFYPGSALPELSGFTHSVVYGAILE